MDKRSQSVKAWSATQYSLVRTPIFVSKNAPVVLRWCTAASANAHAVEGGAKVPRGIRSSTSGTYMLSRRLTVWCGQVVGSVLQ